MTKMHNIDFKAVQRSYIRGLDVSKLVMCLIPYMFIFKLYLIEIRC